MERLCLASGCVAFVFEDGVVVIVGSVVSIVVVKFIVGFILIHVVSVVYSQLMTEDIVCFRLQETCRVTMVPVTFIVSIVIVLIVIVLIVIVSIVIIVSLIIITSFLKLL